MPPSTSAQIGWLRNIPIRTFRHLLSDDARSLEACDFLVPISPASNKSTQQQHLNYVYGFKDRVLIHTMCLFLQAKRKRSHWLRMMRFSCEYFCVYKVGQRIILPRIAHRVAIEWKWEMEMGLCLSWTEFSSIEWIKDVFHGIGC